MESSAHSAQPRQLCSALVLQICVYEEMLSSRPRGQPALSTANSSRSLGASASGRSMASYSTMGARSAVPSGPSKVSSIASEVIPEDDDESYVQAEREDGGNWQIRHFAVRTYGAT